VVFAFSYASAQQVTYETIPDFYRCESDTLTVSVTTTDEVAAIEIVFEVAGDGVADFDVLDVKWLTSFGYLTDYRFIDKTSRVHATGPDTIRLAAINITGSPLPAGTYDVAIITFTTNRACNGTTTVDPATWVDYVNPVGDIVTRFVLTDASEVLPTINSGGVTQGNRPPTIDPIPNDSLSWDYTDTYTYTASAADPDNCEKLEFSLPTAPTGMTIDPVTGAIFWDPSGDQVCQNSVVVRVTDSCGISASTNFKICVYNDPPAFTCTAPFDTSDVDEYMCDGDTILVGAGEMAHGFVQAFDPDGGPNNLEFLKVSFDGPGTASVDPLTGEFNWDTDILDYAGADFVYELKIKVTDNATTCSPCSPENADTASFFIEVVPLRFIIEKEHGPDGKGVYQGQFTEVSINMPDDSFINHPIGGFDFLIQYDNSVLTFMKADPGLFIDSCGWEYFTYRTGPFGNCGSACPSGMVRIVGLADYNTGTNHPRCFSNDAGVTEVANFTFLVSNDRTYECMFVPIRFIWIDCGDNTVSDVDGTRLFLSRRVYDYYGDMGADSYVEITDTNLTEPFTPFPTIYGAPWNCEDVDGKTEIWRFIDFFNGGVDIACADSIDDRGDLNLDGLPYTIADAVMYSNYFIKGLSALVYVDPGAGYEASIAASDVNADGIPLSVADLVYLIRVIVGDAFAYSKLSPVEAKLTYNGNGVISIDGDIQVAAALVVVEGETAPNLMADNMFMDSYYDGVNTRILVRSPLEKLESFTGEFLQVDGQVISTELADIEGNPIVAKLVPTDFGLSQNYPNPFNPTTTIEFALPFATDYTLTIYNITGQVVEVFSGSADAGYHQVVWDAGANVASGVYFYKLNAGDFNDTKKMVLLK
jgi:hypothetical protein